MLVSIETGGLGNRIKSWVSAQRLSAEPKLYWPITSNMPSRFDELFLDGDIVDEVPPGAETYKSWRLAILPEDEPYLPEGFAVVGAGAHPFVRAGAAAWWRLRGRPDDRYRYMLFPKQHSKRSTRGDARHIDLEYGRIPEQLRAVWVPLFRRLRPQAHIDERAGDWWRSLGEDAIVGVQVRTWRDDPRRYRKYHLPARSRLLRLMQAQPRDTRFLIVSDSDEFVDELSGQFERDRLVSFPRTTPRNDSYTSTAGMAEDLIDMLLLARCGRLFASYLSTFSETAWWLGGARAEVDVF